MLVCVTAKGTEGIRPMAKVSPVNGQPVPRGRPFTSESAREANRTRTEKHRARASVTASVRKKLPETVEGADGTKAEAVADAIIDGSIAGNVKMIELLLAIIGEDPAQRIEVSAMDPAARAEVDRLIAEVGAHDGETGGDSAPTA